MAKLEVILHGPEPPITPAPRGDVARHETYNEPEFIDLTYDFNAAVNTTNPNKGPERRRTMQNQIEQQLDRINPSPSGGLVSTEGFGWREVYRDKSKEIMGVSVFEVETDIVTQTPTTRSNFLPSFQMSAGHKALMPGVRKRRKGPSTESSMVTIVERDGTDGTLRRKWVEPREEMFGRLAGYYRDRVDGLWFKKPVESEPQALKSIPLETLIIGGGQPSAYQQIIEQRRAAGLDGVSTALAWKQGSLYIRVSEEEQAAPATIYGSVARRVVKVDTFDELGRRVNQAVYEDNSESGGVKPLKASNSNSYEKFINEAAANAAQPMTDLHFEVELTEDEKQQAREENAYTERERELYDIYPGLAFLAVTGAQDTPEQQAVVHEALSKEEAIDMLAGISEPSNYTPFVLDKLRRETLDKSPPHIVKALQDLVAETGKDGLVTIVNDLMVHYLNIMNVHTIPVDSQDLNYGWLVRALASERLKAARPSYAHAMGHALSLADPIGNGPESNLKRLEIVEGRIGQRFFDYVAPLKTGWSKTIDEHTAKEAFKKAQAREILPHISVRLERSIRGQLQELVKHAAEVEASQAVGVNGHDRLMVEIGKLLSISASF